MAGIISKIWLQEQFDQIDKANSILLVRTDDIQRLTGLILVQVNELLKLTKPNPDVTPELEAAVKQVAKRAASIDEKVPDKNVPPGSTTPT